VRANLAKDGKEHGWVSKDLFNDIRTPPPGVNVRLPRDAGSITRCFAGGDVVLLALKTEFAQCFGQPLVRWICQITSGIIGDRLTSSDGILQKRQQAFEQLRWAGWAASNVKVDGNDG